MVGTVILMGAKHSTSQALILIEGKALRLPAASLRKEAKRSSRMREVMLTYANALQSHSAQLAACHRYHTPKERLARLLLMIDDRLKTPDLRITQDILARLLGTRRATVMQASNLLQDSRLIESVRGRIKLLDRAGIEKEACSCYAIIAGQQRPTDQIKLVAKLPNKFFTVSTFLALRYADVRIQRLSACTFLYRNSFCVVQDMSSAMRSLQGTFI